ncbi:MAG: 50S ribosomal protein L21 [Dehalococcoidales bacterium]|nr:50S ribosomal protein L21 [Dehalococcoidales bacterium]
MEGKHIYAIIETGGKQYRVTPGQVVDVDCLNVTEGEAVEIAKVLVLGDDTHTSIGKPAVEGAKVLATSQGTVRGDKIIVYKFKAKTRYRRHTGHHQLFTRLTIDKIEVPEHHTRGRHKKEEAVSGS